MFLSSQQILIAIIAVWSWFYQFNLQKKPTKTAQMDGDLITINNFFGHWITDIDIRRYPDDMRILPTNNNVEFYQF